MNTCTICREIKPMRKFKLNLNMARGIINQCNTCLATRERKYYEKNRGIDAKDRTAYIQAWKDNNPEKHAEYNKKYRRANKDKVDAYSKLRWKNNREVLSARSKVYRQKNKAKVSATRKAWSKRNPGIQLAHAKRYAAKKAGLVADFTADQWLQKLDEHNHRCVYCMTHQDDLRAVLQQEHIVPVSKGGGYTWDNIVPACRFCNASKRDQNLLAFIASA